VTEAATPELTPEAFRERFALATFPDGGVVVDLKTGSYSRLNAAGAVVFEEVERAESFAQAAERIADRLSITQSVASEHVDTMFAALGGEGIRREPPDPFRYRPSPEGGYDVWHGDTLALHVDEPGRLLTLVSPPDRLPLRIYDYVSGIAPKLLFLRGIAVMHGSSCLRAGSLLGICGKSRSGKTTTARMLSNHGWPLTSVDLLVFAPNLSEPTVYMGGESSADQWARRASDAFAAGPGSAVSVDDLLEAASGRSMPLRCLWFLDVARRRDAFARRQLGRAATLVNVMANQFLGAGGSSNWRRHLLNSRALAGALDAYELDMPTGLERLDVALRDYATNSAS
jgi:hypothetical protein